MPIFIGAIKVNNISSGGSVNIPTLGGVIASPVAQQKFQTAALNYGDASPSVNTAPIFDPDGVDNPSGVVKGF